MKTNGNSMGKNKGFFIASTGQHVGKTTSCLGLVSGLKKRFKNVGFLKPIGQEHVAVQDGISVDKDVILFKDYFGLKDPYELMSPVIFPSGFTRDYLDGKIPNQTLVDCIDFCYENLTQSNDIVVIEGTGHTGVGTIAELNNARVASLLNVKMVLIASGGLGSSFDAIALNKALCDMYKVPIAGIILNKVIPSKRDMIIEYMTKALLRWNIPLLGCIPYDAFLSNPTIADYASLFDTELVSGKKYNFRHFENIRLIATSVDVYQSLIAKSQLIITPASREDIILSTLSRHWDIKIANPKDDLESGMILTGSQKPSKQILEELHKADIPSFYTSANTFEAMKAITSYTAKLRKEDSPRVEEAIDLVEGHIDFDRLLKAVNIPL